MQKLRKNLPAVIACALLTVMASLSVLVTLVSGGTPTKQIIWILMGLVFILAVSFVKEEHLHKAALPIYIVSVAILTVQLFFEDYSYGFDRYLFVGAIAFYTASLLPLTSIQIAKSITKYSEISGERIVRIIVLALIPIGLVFAQVNMTPVVAAMTVFAIGVVLLKKEKRINIPWRVLAIPVILFAILLVARYMDGYYFSDKIDVIFTRGASAPLAEGWVRTVLDAMFKNTPAVGASDYSPDGSSLTETLAYWGDYKIAILLAEYGWLAFIGALLVYVGFFICVFKMVSGIKQSTFAKYTALFFALALLVQASYSIIGLFLLDSAYLNLPFIGGYTRESMNYLLFGVILTLYIKRDQPSVIREETDEKPYTSLYKRIYDYMLAAEEEENDDEEI